MNIDALIRAAQNSEPKYFEKEQIEAWLKAATLDLKKHYEKPQPLIKFVEANGREVDVCTMQNISCTMGAAKSKKTFYSSILAASLLGNTEFAISGNLRGRKILFIDTEQAPYHVYRVGKRIEKMINAIQTDLITMLILRNHGVEERMAISEMAISSGQYSFVIIDGIVDMVYDFNDLRESTVIVNKLMKLSMENNCHINSVIHTNKDAMNARGHLGAFLMNKSESVFKITKTDTNASSVHPEFTRNQPFEDWEFSVNEHGIPERNLKPVGYYQNIEKKIAVNVYEPVEYNQNIITENNDLPF